MLGVHLVVCVTTCLPAVSECFLVYIYDFFFSMGCMIGAAIGVAAPFGFAKKRWLVYMTESFPGFSLHACLT